MAPWCRGAAYVPWHGSTSNVVNKVPGRAVVQRKLEPSRDGPSVRPCDRHAGGAAIKRRHQSSSIIVIMPARLRLASCREPLAANRLQRATCGEPAPRAPPIADCKRADILSVKRRLFSPNALRCQKTDQLKQLNSELYIPTKLVLYSK